MDGKLATEEAPFHNVAAFRDESDYLGTPKLLKDTASALSILRVGNLQTWPEDLIEVQEYRTMRPM